MESGQGVFTPLHRIGQLTMRNLDITDTCEQLAAFRDAGLWGPRAFEGMRPLEGGEGGGPRDG